MANGTIAFDTLQTSGQISGTAKSVDADYLAYGSAKSWWHCQMYTPSLSSSFNTGFSFLSLATIDSFFS